MMQDLDTLANFVKESFPNDAHMPGMTVSAAVSSAACPVGKVVVVVPGNKSELERTVCGKQMRVFVVRLTVLWLGAWACWCFD